MDEVYDLVVIGGGPAGSATALYALRTGLSVCIVEKAAFPRETLCGEFLSHEVTEVLADLGLTSEFLELEPNPIGRLVLCHRRGGATRAPLGFQAFGLTRGRFDALLLSAARRAGAVVLQPGLVTHVKEEHGGFILECTSQDQLMTVRSRLVVDASGRSSVLETQRDPPVDEGGMRYAAVKFHIPISLLNGIEGNEIVLALGKGIYCGINAVGQGVATICYLDHRPHHAPPMRDRIRQLADENRVFGDMVKGPALEALRTAPIYGTGKLRFGPRDIAAGGVIKVGDTAGIIAPLAGDGISMALQGAQLYGELLNSVRSGVLGDEQFASEYQRRWRRRFHRRFRVALLCQQLAMSSAFGGNLSSVVSAFPSVLTKLISATRG